MKGVSGQQMAIGLELCRDNSPEWPVGSAEFRAYCLGKGAKTEKELRQKAIDADESRRVSREFRLSDTGAQDRAKKARDSAMKDWRAKLTL